MGWETVVLTASVAEPVGDLEVAAGIGGGNDLGPVFSMCPTLRFRSFADISG